MTVALTPPPKKGSKRKNRGSWVDTSNGQWRAMTTLANAFGEDVPVWNGFHDPGQTYTPEQLRAMARRIEQLKDTPAWLEELAAAGGATVS